MTKGPSRFRRLVSRLGQGRLGMITHALETFSDNRASQAAAALAYYAFFSLFPLMLLIIAAGSYLLDIDQLFRAVLQLVQAAIPISNQLLAENLRRVLEARGPVGIVGLLTLLWSASGFFTSLAYNINLAWPKAPKRGFLERRVVGLMMITGLAGLLVLSLVLDSITTLIPIVRAGSLPFSGVGLWDLFSRVGSWAVILLLFVAMYRWIPTRRVAWRAALGGALTASVGWKVATIGFAWYLKSGLGRYQLVYGSLGAVVALLVLLYTVGVIALFGAHLAAAIDRRAGRSN